MADNVHESPVRPEQGSENGDTISPARSVINSSRTKSFVDLDVIKDKDEWHASRPTAKKKRRNGSIKGLQSFSRFNREFYFPQNGADEFEKMIGSWILATCLAVVVSIAGLFIDAGVICTSYAVYGVSQTAIIDKTHGHATNGEVVGAYFAFVAMALFFAILASLLVVFISPLSEGSGIPAVKSYLNGVHLAGLFSFPTMVAKGVGCAFAIGSGLIAGREGPIIHVGAIVGAAISQGSSQTFQMRLPDTIVKHFRSAEWKRDFAVMGSACGVAAAFGAPMGGVLFAIEEGATVWRQQLTFLTMFAACLTAFITSCLKTAIEKPGHAAHIPEVLFGSFKDSSPYIDFTTIDAPYVLLLGICGGIIGSLYSQLQRYVIAFRKSYIRPSQVRTIVEVVVVSILISTVRFVVPYVFGKCIDGHNFEEAVGHGHFSGVPLPDPFFCEHGEVNNLGQLFWVPMSKSLKFLLHAEAYDAVPVGYLFAALLFNFVGAVIVFGMAIPSGLFIPSFMIGACLGRIVGLLAASQTGNYDMITSYTFLGCAAVLGGMTRVTISVAMIALESTQNFNASLYCFISVIIAKLFADSINIGIYDLVIEMKEIPFLVDDLGYEGYQISMDDIMVPTKDKEIVEIDDGITLEQNSKNSNPDGMGVIKSLDTVANIFALLRDNPSAHDFLVTNEYGGVEGTIERLIIVRLLENKNFGENPALLHPTSIDSAWPNLRNDISEEGEAKLSAKLTEEVPLNSIVDLRPYVDCDPAIVLTTGSMRKAHSHIRNGERVVLVANPNSVHIVGAVKRQDIMPGFLEATLEVKKHVYARERKKSAVGSSLGDLDDDEDMDKSMTDGGDEEALPKYDPKKAELVDSSNEQYVLNPFEPRFYELLFHWLQHHRYLGFGKDHVKERHSVTGGRYEMVSKPQSYRDVHTLSGK